MRELAVKYLWNWLGIPYHWGGDNGLQGWDCSGLIIEVLQATGVLQHNFDDTAHGLYLRFKDKKTEKGYTGCLVFWFKDGKAIHIEMMIDENCVIGASGGGSKVKSLADAIKQNAFVKMRPLGYRGDNYKICDPFKVNHD